MRFNTASSTASWIMGLFMFVFVKIFIISAIKTHFLYRHIPNSKKSFDLNRFFSFKCIKSFPPFRTMKETTNQGLMVSVGCGAERRIRKRRRLIAKFIFEVCHNGLNQLLDEGRLTFATKQL